MGQETNASGHTSSRHAEPRLGQAEHVVGKVGLLLGRRGRSAPLLETFAAKHRPALGRLEGNRGFLAASRTIRAGFDLGVAASRGCPQARRAFRLAGFAAFRFVLELLIVEEKLFPSGEDEVTAAVDTLKNLVLEFHGELLPSVHEPSDKGVRLRLPHGSD